MRVLHLSDLHLSDGNRRAIGNWKTAKEHFDDKFDFIVISGDLANTGKSGEYDRVAEFLKLVVERVKGGDPSRVVIVPGNHDVDHGRAIGGPLTPPLASQPEGDHPPEFPERSNARYREGAGGGREVIWIDDSIYHLRFEGFAKLVKNFYGSSSDNHRFFDLEHPGAEGDWSVHTFPEDGVVFYGLNSCCRNDSIWRGASFSPSALEEIRRHIETKTSHLMRIAVWHHGLASGRGDHDFITAQELAELAAAGLNVGIHGHTHCDEQRNLADVLRRWFPVISTGSFGARQEQRPDSLRNQFSVLTIDRNHVKCRVYDLEERRHRWKLSSEQVSLADGPASQLREAMAHPEIDWHRRHTVVDDNGIATVRVRMKTVVVEGPLILASPMRGFDRIEFDQSLEAHQTSGTTVVRDQFEVHIARPHRFVAHAVLEGRRYEQIDWAYYFSNGFALDGLDIRLGLRRGQQILPLGADEDAYLYLVEAHTNRLELRLTFPATTSIESARPIAQKPIGHGQFVQWENDINESAHPKLRDGHNPFEDVRFPTNDLSLVVEAPKVGYRYGVVYGLGLRRRSLEPEDESCLSEILRSCRHEPLRARNTVGQFTTAVNQALVKELGPASVPKFWTAHLWKAEDHKLLPAFGKFPPDSWGSSFDYGSGVAGQAFRIRGPAIYCRSDADKDPVQHRKTRLIYREGRYLGDHNWIIQVPILLSRKAPPIAVGVVGFADHGTPQAGDEELKRTAMQAAWDGVKPTLLHALSLKVSHAFWQVAAKQGLRHASNIFNGRWKNKIARSRRSKADDARR